MAAVTKPLPLDETFHTTEGTPRNVADVLAEELARIAGRDASQVNYDNSGSGLSATDVQNALDEIVGNIPTVNNGTLNIQQNGTSKGSFTANSASNVNVNIETPTADKKTATDEFTTADGGLLSKCQINLVPVQSGSGDPSPDNVRPISGHTEVDLYNVGKNRCPLTLSKIKAITHSGTWSDNVYTESGIKLTFYTLSATNDSIIKIHAQGTSSSAINFELLNTNDVSWLGSLTSVIVSGSPDDARANTECLIVNVNGGESLYIEPSRTVSVSGATSFRFRLTIWSGKTINSDYYPMVRDSSVTDSTFDPYLGHLYQVQIGSTVYGGYVDLVSGVMVATKAGVDLGSLTWSKVTTSVSGKYRYLAEVSPMPKYPSDVYAIINAICSQYVAKSRMDIYNAIQGVSFTGDGKISAYDDSLADVSESDFKSAMSGVQFVYELATPQTINLTPQQIETLSGQNNLSTPLSGQSIETNGVEYKELFTFADVKSYVDKKIPDAPTTDGTYTLTAVVSGGVPTYSWT